MQFLYFFLPNFLAMFIFEDGLIIVHLICWL